MDIKSRLPGCAGQAADAVSAYTQVKMEDAPSLFKIPKSECPDIWRRLPQHKWLSFSCDLLSFRIRVCSVQSVCRCCIHPHSPQQEACPQHHYASAQHKIDNIEDAGRWKRESPVAFTYDSEECARVVNHGMRSCCSRCWLATGLHGGRNLHL